MQAAKAALNRAARIVQVKPEFGQRTFAATAVLEDGMRCKLREKDIELIADVPASMGGENAGPTPTMLLRCAMASCIAIGIKSFAARADIPLGRIDVRFETDVDARGQLGVSAAAAPGFEAGRLMIRVQTAADPASVHRAIDRSLAFSPLLDAVRCRTPIELAIEVNEQQEDPAL